MTAAIRQCSPGFGLSSLPLLDQGSSVPTEHILRAMLRDMELLPDKVIIILDDYHCIELPSIHDSLSYMLERLPSQVRLIIASRTVPDIPIAKLLVNGELNRITMHDLMFECNEVIALFRHMNGFELTNE
ncbi:hypothetical protein PCCS19_19640 [Paenibacillus sp. CCS19]|uniref:hypothetical protein n=1 Tax=Paenibacillus sp. CCS19 TaxID=3158387 RepID=UPI0025644FDD|nr:hypothetical protein [Paenibacillus cellulosilyticus]GMK38910.1 hypothetical protein PCCS19_19640 [Paenibacillus cellulosilyticus]